MDPEQIWWNNHSRSMRIWGQQSRCIEVMDHPPGAESIRSVATISGRFLLTHSGCASSSIKYQKSRWTSRETINFNSHGQFVCSYTCYFHKKPRYQFDRNDDVLFINQFHWWLENAGNGTVSPISNSNFLGHWIRRSPYSFFFRLSQDFD